MKLHYDVQYPQQFEQNRWEQLKQFTDARIALGRTGGSLPTRPLLEFQLAHAQAKDAVLKPLDLELLSQQLKQQTIPFVQVSSCAVDKDTYLKRPDLGRELSETSRQMLTAMQSVQQQYDVLIVAGDGLSARAIEDNAASFITKMFDACAQQGWSVAPIVVATGSRVALGDEIAQILNAQMLVMLIGERPGLSSPDSMGIYYTWQAQKGCHDAMRNCISNVRPAGLDEVTAVQRLIALMSKSKQLQFSGVNLKDEHEMTIEQGQSQLLHGIF
ncbi:ethanolamine ammonia-lyase subunit EutC [Acinetobacter sp. ANC 4178]|uniref:ethanolamine ammonia-lyase subunit EutC n=1 Tax=Acinetobacter sp. ANC 4178 TaxID=2529839 RepID=UPI0010402556|nr:ethanolamine ammonia-lyase subunit EutC [Acinetobacter sp. ANC 4178]TCB67028.1 ethanolamine ammonia-lyase subunit EutC [Acinetobacter sp. ANC 4178]